MHEQHAARATTRPGDSARAVAVPAAADSANWSIQAFRLNGPPACVNSIRRILAAILGRRLRTQKQPKGGK